MIKRINREVLLRFGSSRCLLVILFVLLLQVLHIVESNAMEQEMNRTINMKTYQDIQGWEDVERYWDEMDRELGEFMPEFSLQDAWQDGMEEGILSGIKGLFNGLARYFMNELVINIKLLGQLILLSVVSALLKNLQSAFQSEEVARLTEAIAFMVLLGLALGSFSLAVKIGKNAVEEMVGFMFALLPVLLTLLASLGHITSVSLFHPLIIFSVNMMAKIVNEVIFPLIYFSTILFLASHFSPQLKVNRLAELFKDISIWSLGFMLTLFTGLTAIQGIAGSVGDALTLRTAKFITGSFIPVVGKMLADAVETVLGYSILLKNGATIAGLITLSLIVTFPLVKLLILIFIYKFAGALVQPIGETSLGEALNTMGNCLAIIFAAVATVALVFFIGVSIIAGASNAAVMLR